MMGFEMWGGSGADLARDPCDCVGARGFMGAGWHAGVVGCGARATAAVTRCRSGRSESMGSSVVGGRSRLVCACEGLVASPRHEEARRRRPFARNVHGDRRSGGATFVLGCGGRSASCSDVRIGSAAMGVGRTKPRAVVAALAKQRARPAAVPLCALGARRACGGGHASAERGCGGIDGVRRSAHTP